MFYKVVGLMSGTSLDGLDMAYCEFEKQQEGWKFSIVKAEINNWFTVPSLKYQCTPGIAWCSGLRDDFCQPFHPSYHKKTSQGIPWKVLSCHILS